MSLILQPIKQNKKSVDTKTIKAEELFNRILSHDNDMGAQSEISFGQPGSCKTAVDCSIADYFMKNHPEDKLFWRNPLRAPLQVFKLPRWQIFLEEGGGIRLYNRDNGKDITDKMEQKGEVIYFKTFPQLVNKAQGGVLNCVFFRDSHVKNVENDKGTLQWFSFIRYLTEFNKWYHIFLDEYQEMAKAGNQKKMWHLIDEHSNDISSARKCNVGLHVNCHQTHEIDHKVLANIMIVLQMYGSKPYKHSPVTKKAIGGIKRPTELLGAEAWISEGGNFGKMTFKEVYKLPKHLNVGAKLLSDKEEVKYCEYCHEAFIPKRKNQLYCNESCKKKYLYRKKDFPSKSGKTPTPTI